jgi:hypothetical protein
VIGLDRHRHQRPHPEADIGVLAQQLVRKFERDPEHVLVGEEVGAGELETVEEAEQVEEERVAAEAGEEPDAVVGHPLADDRLRAEAHRCPLDQRLLVPVDVPVCDLTVQLGAALGGEAVAKRQIRHGVAVGVDQRLVERVGTELVRVRGRQWVHVHDQDRAP